MRYKLLGRSGLRVSELALGTMTFGEIWGWGASKDECRKMFDAFLEAGGNLIDTANRYTDGTAEEYMGEFAAEDRQRLVIATKYTLFTRRDHPNAAGSHRKNMVESLEASLRRLRTDYVDVYFVHAWDRLTPIEEVMRALDDMVRAGKVLFVGVSDMPAWVISRANTLAELRGWISFVGMQTEYSLILRDAERELLPMAGAFDLGVMAWGSLGSGVLTGKYNPDRRDQPDTRRIQGEEDGRLNQRNFAIADTVREIAEEVGRTPAQVALNWVRQQGEDIIPILGARKISQFQDNLACLEFRLTPEQLQRLDTVSRIDLGFPSEFLASEGITDLVYGGYLSQIDRPHWAR